MRFWEGGGVRTALAILVLLLGAELVARLVPALRRLGLPLAILAGTAGLLLGDQALAWIHLDTQLLESAVYHGLAVVFIAVGLQAPAGGGRSAGARSMAFAIPFMMGTQDLLGLGAVLLLDRSLHPGFGLLLPMGFKEGPGRALSMGAAWEASGLPAGAQVGLVTAVLNYAWCVVAGIPLVIWGRRRGWAGSAEAAGWPSAQAPAVDPAAESGIEALGRQAALVGFCYLLTWAACAALARALSGSPDLAAMVWGFHFIIGATIAMIVRSLLDRVPGPALVDNALMGRLGGTTVDLITASALAAVQLTVLRAHWLPIALVTTLGGLWTPGLCVWMARRAWTEAPFEHAVLWFGMSTGTLPTGLALLRVVDPELRRPAAVSAVFGSAGSIPGVAPLLLLLIPATVQAFGTGWPGRGWLMLGALAPYCLIVLVLWRAVGGLRFRRPLGSAWPPLADPKA